MSRLRHDLVAVCLHHGGRRTEGGGSPESSELATAAVQGVDGLEVYLSRFVPQVILSALVPVAVLLWCTIVDIQSAVIMTVTLPLVPLLSMLVGHTAADRSAQSWTSLVRLSGHFLDVVRGLPTLRAFNRGRAQQQRIAESSDQYRRATMATLRLAFMSGFVVDLATTLSIALVAVSLGVRLVEGSVGLAPAMTVLLLVPELYAPIRAVGALYHASADGFAGTSRILDLVDPPPTREPVPTPALTAHRELDPRTRPVKLENATKRFAGRSTPALDDVTLVIEPGETVAVVGPSGSGKTTLGKALLGLARLDSGAVMAGDTVVTEAALDLWRTKVAWAPQRPTMLHASVRDNIALGYRPPPADRASGQQVDQVPGGVPRGVGPPLGEELDRELDQEVAAAARLAAATELVDGLPDGSGTIIGAGGRGLSAGQVHQIGLARALFRKAPLLVLDEPTAHLDDTSRKHVIASLAGMRGQQSMLLLTHDPELAAVADRIVPIRDGSLAALSASTRPAPAGGATVATGMRS